MENVSQQPIPHGVLDCLEQFDYAPSPQAIIDLYDAYRIAATTGETDAVNKFCDVMTALSLYPEDCATEPHRATELYSALAASDNPYHVELVVRLIPKLWVVDPEGARHITEGCMLRPLKSAQDKRIHGALEALLNTSYSMGRMVVRSQTRDGIVLLSAERLKRRPQEAS